MAATLLLPPRPSIGGFVKFVKGEKPSRLCVYPSPRETLNDRTTWAANTRSSSETAKVWQNRALSPHCDSVECSGCWYWARRRLVNKGYGLISDCWRSIVSLSTSPFHAYAMRRFLCRGKQAQGKIKNCGNCCGQRETGIEWIYSQTWCWTSY